MVAKEMKLSTTVLALRHDNRRSTFQYAMAWARTELKWAGIALNRPRGVWRLTQFGRSISEAQLLEFGGKGRRGPSQVGATPSPPPPLPQQGPGPHFTVHDGRLAFAEGVDPHGNDLFRLRSLMPIVRETAGQLVRSLSKHEGLWPDLERAARNYERLLAEDVEALDYGRLFGQGIVLANALRAARLPEARGNAYELVPECTILADSLLEMHGPLILGTKDGQALVRDAERFQNSEEQLAEFRRTEVDLSLAIARSPSLAAPDVKLHITDILSSTKDPERPDHFQSYLSAMVQNVSLIIVGGITVSTAAVIFASGTALPLASIAAGIFGAEALKKSQPGQSLTQGLSHLIDRAAVDFVVKNERLFRELAKRPSMRWLDKALTWSLSQSPDTISRVPDGNVLQSREEYIPEAADERASLHLLGEPLLTLEDGTAVKLRQKVYALAAMIYLEFRDRTRRTTLAERIWEDSTLEQALTNLRQTLLHTRELEARHGFELFDADATEIELSRRISLDLREISRVRAATDARELERLIALYRGELLSGIDGLGEGFDQWLAIERSRIEDQFVAQATEAAFRIGGRDGHVALDRLAERLPYSDTVCRASISMYLDENNEAGARTALEAFRVRLRRGLGLDPAPETLRMLDRQTLSPGAKISVPRQPRPNKLRDRRG